MVLDTEDIDALDRVRSKSLGRLATRALEELLDDAIDANQKLLDRLDTTLARIGRFRESGRPSRSA